MPSISVNGTLAVERIVVHTEARVGALCFVSTMIESLIFIGFSLCVTPGKITAVYPQSPVRGVANGNARPSPLA